MPFISTKTNVSISSVQEEQMRCELGKAIELIPGKTEKWLMLEFEGSKAISFAGSTEPCAMISASVYGHGSSDSYASFTKEATEIVSRVLGIPSERVYIAYFQTDLWGWTGTLF